MKATTDDIHLVSAVRAAGLTANQAKVYLAVLEMGPSSIWDIAVKSGIKRTTCYDILTELAEQGYASKIDLSKHSKYSVISPKQLVAVVERKLQRISSSTPELEALASKSKEMPKARFFEGRDGVMKAYELCLGQPRGSELLLYGTDEVEIDYPEFFKELIATRVKRGISLRSIFADKPYNRQILVRNPQELRETRFLPISEYDPSTALYVCGDMLAYIAHSEKEPHAMIVESAALARAERERFNILWKIATT